MGKEASGAEESFSDGLLEYPQYTRPQEFEGRTIPEVLTSGDHAKVAAWRRAEAERLTRERRPDLWAARSVAAKTEDETGDKPRCFDVEARPNPDMTQPLAALPCASLGAPPTERFAMNIIQQLEQSRSTSSPPARNSGLRAGRHRDRQREGQGRRAHPRAGLRGRLHRALRRRPQRELHGPQDFLRRRRRARVPAAIRR